jgi:hypothetical protein
VHGRWDALFDEPFLEFLEVHRAGLQIPVGQELVHLLVHLVEGVQHHSQAVQHICGELLDLHGRVQRARIVKIVPIEPGLELLVAREVDSGVRRGHRGLGEPNAKLG